MRFSLQLLTSTICSIHHYGSCYTLVRLLGAFSDAVDPVSLLAASARDHIPHNTSLGGGAESSHILNSDNRQPIDQIVEEIYEQKWYLNQIKYRRTIDEKVGSIGKFQSDYALILSYWA
jgi:hypothetical protein